jgi:hypothetical protein
MPPPLNDQDQQPLNITKAASEFQAAYDTFVSVVIGVRA